MGLYKPIKVTLERLSGGTHIGDGEYEVVDHENE
jgi:hypothetical protein